MSTKLPVAARIREVGPRDGFQNEPEVISTAVGAVDLLNLRRPSASGLPAGHPPSLVSDDNDDRIFDERYARIYRS